MKYILVGCGGVGSWAAYALTKLVRDPVVLVDKDILEKKNLDRQLFTERDLGLNKAAALARHLNCEHTAAFFSIGVHRMEEDDYILMFADNHPARLAALQESDRTGCRVITASNETTSSEAFYFEPGWKNTPLDPRVYYPEILTDTSGDPRRAEACTGEAQQRNRQLVTANLMAASLALHLLVVWQIERPKLKKEDADYLPYHLKCNLSKMESLRVCDRLERTANE